MLEKQNTTSLSVERAIDELRRQSAIALSETTHYPVEFLTLELLESIRTGDSAVLITAARAKSLNLPAHDTKIDAATLSFGQIQSICDPLSETPLPAFTPREASATHSLALKLAKHAAIIPALFTSSKTTDALRVNADDITAYFSAPQSHIIQTAKASLPIEGAEKASLISFRSQHATSVHLALIIGDIGANPLTRIHSSCVTGDILGSLRCDCGDQLKLALADITKAGSGILVYLHQEGRGIGITNKLRSYQLQEKGHDTFTANLMLGFDEDERDFTIAAAILQIINVPSIRMLTNNPHKLAAMEKTGIRVSERVSLVSASHSHNHAYIEAKTSKAGHLF